MTPVLRCLFLLCYIILPERGYCLCYVNKKMPHKTVLFYATYRCFPALIRCKGTTFFWNMQEYCYKKCVFFSTPYL